MLRKGTGMYLFTSFGKRSCHRNLPKCFAGLTLAAKLFWKDKCLQRGGRCVTPRPVPAPARLSCHRVRPAVWFAGSPVFACHLPRLPPRHRTHVWTPAPPPPHFWSKSFRRGLALTPSPWHPGPLRVLRGAFPSNLTWVDHTPHDQRSTRCSDTDRPWRFIICINARPSHAVKLLKLFRKRTSTWPVLPLRWGQRWCLQLDVRQSGACFVL